MSNRPLTIAMVGAKGVPATFGGVERVVEELGARLAARGHRVLVASRETYAGKRLRDWRGMEVVEAPWHLRRKGFDSLSAAATAALRILTRARLRPDVLHLHGLGVAPLAVLARWAGVACVTQMHGLEWRNAQWSGAVKRYFRWCEHPAVRWPDVATAVGVPDAEGLSTRQGRNVIALANGVTIPDDTRLAALRAAPAPADLTVLAPGRYALFVGRLMPEKGPQHLLAAFEQAVAGSQLPADMRLAMVGDAPGRETFAADLRALPAASADRVHFVGFRYGEELAWLFANAGLFVLPSETEGLSLTLLEAMAHAAPIHASAIPQNTTVLAGTGTTSPPGDVVSLAGALADHFTDPSAAADRQVAARARARSYYAWDVVVDRLESIYRQALARAVTARPA